jgi:hypothetical protein
MALPTTTDWWYRRKISFFLYEAKEFAGPAMTQGGLRAGCTWADKKYDGTALCRNCTNQIRAVGAIDFESATGMINDARIVGAHTFPPAKGGRRPAGRVQCDLLRSDDGVPSCSSVTSTLRGGGRTSAPSCSPA